MATMLSDTDINKQLELSKGQPADLCIRSAEPQEDCITPIGYDVRAGDTLFSYQGRRIKSFKHEEFTIWPGDTVYVSSYESFELSRKLGGVTISRLGPQLDGLQMQALTVDPTWKGELLIILTNHGTKPAKIKYKQKLMTLCFFWMDSSSTKEVDRKRWNNENIMEQFKQIERAARKSAWRRRIVDFVVGGVLALLLWQLRQRAILETNVQVVLSGVSSVAFYASTVRTSLFRRIKWLE